MVLMLKVIHFKSEIVSELEACGVYEYEYYESAGYRVGGGDVLYDIKKKC
jgi:hypothetical protein